MDKNAVWKWLILVVCVSVSGAIVSHAIKTGFPLGLDLKGGSSFVVQIDEASLRADLHEQYPKWTDLQLDAELPTAVGKAQSRAIDVIRGRIDTLGIREPDIYAERNNRIVIQLPGIDAKTRSEAEAQIMEVGYLSFRLVHKDNSKLVSTLWERKLAPEGYRVEEITDERGYRGEFFVKIDNAPVVVTGEQLWRFGNPPSGYIFMLARRTINGQEAYSPYYVNYHKELTGEHITRAWDSPGSFIEPIVNLEFDAQGKKKFRQITTDYCVRGKRNMESDEGRQLAIVLDDILYSAPELKTPIIDGKAIIEGIRSQEEARHLANILEAGSLPARVEIIEKHAVDASLGKDSIQSGVKAALLGGIIVAVFMLIYYMLAGVVANIALALDMILLPLGMVLAAGFLGIFAGKGGGAGSGVVNLPVLTLPGIAGIALTIGMAVDANVLIFERIREELRAGKTIKAAIAAGFDRAFLAIFDSNITTLLSAIILFVVGSGPVRGFAVTLSAGIIVSMYTAIVVSRMCFDLTTAKTRITTLKMLQFVGETKIEFLKWRQVAIGGSAILIIATISLAAVKYMKDPGNILGVEFMGGSSVTFLVQDESKKPSVAEVRDTLAGAGIQAANIQYKQNLDKSGAGQLMIRTSLAPVEGKKAGDAVKSVMIDKFASMGISEGQQEEVGPQVGSEMRKRAMWAIIGSLLIMIVYISWRFEFAYAMGATVALAHDVLVTIGVYCLLGREISLTIVAALMTIIGYSVNDTIVVFDRIRENLKDSELRRKMTYREICNYSMNQMLSRTILTSLTVFVAVVVLLLFGGGSINDFALAMTIGVVAGVYSTVFIATPVMLFWHPEKRASANKA